MLRNLGNKETIIMKRYFTITLCLIVTCLSLSAKTKVTNTEYPIAAGYYFLQTPRSESGFAYVGQVHMPSTVVARDDNNDLYRLCWSLERGFTIPEHPNCNTAAYIFRFIPDGAMRDTLNVKANIREIQPGADLISYSQSHTPIVIDHPGYHIQNLGTGRYIMSPEGIYHAARTSTTPEEYFYVRRSEMLQDGFTIRGGNPCKKLEGMAYLHSASDVNAVVNWGDFEQPSHWRLIPVSEEYAMDAFRIYSPQHQAEEDITSPGKVCNAPTNADGTPLASSGIIPAIVRQYLGQPVCLIVWSGNNGFSYSAIDRTRAYMHGIKGKGVKVVYVTDEGTDIYRWLNLIKVIDADHYRVPSLQGYKVGDAINGTIPAIYTFDPQGNCIQFSLNIDPLNVTDAVKRMDKTLKEKRFIR